MQWTNNDPLAFQVWRGFSNKFVINQAVVLSNQIEMLYNETYTCLDGDNSGLATHHTDMQFTPSSNVVVYTDRIQHTLILQMRQCSRCVALSFRDLADPEWFSIECNQAFPVNMFCAVHRNISRKAQESTKNILPNAKDSFCSRRQIWFERECYLFQWKTNLSSEAFACFRNVIYFEFLFNAIAKSMFSPMALNNFFVAIPIRYFGQYKYTFKNASSRGAFCVVQEEIRQRKITENIFLCNDGTSISAKSLCDGEHNCPDGTDEVGCQCSTIKMSKNCQVYHSTSKKWTCSMLYNKTIMNGCVPYDFRTTKSKHAALENITTQDFICKSGKVISIEKVDDLVIDCILHGDDKFKLQTLLTKTNFYTCQESHMVPCRDGHPQCFDVFEICIFELDLFGHLKNCRTGEHLQQCLQFQCNSMFKCPMLYCIPWSYICDGKWDCVGGIDETENQLCKEKRKCSNLFKCRNSEKCIALQQICDANEECPHKDDELLCSLKHANCPPECTCVTFVLHCEKVTTHTNLKSFHFFRLIFILEFAGRDLSLNLDLSGVFHICLNNCTLTVLCDLLSKPSTVEVVNVPNNNIHQLQPFCFANAQFLKALDIQHNLLSKIERNTFHNMSILKCLNLSSNPLFVIMNGAFGLNNNLRVLSIVNVSLQTLDKALSGVNITYLEVDSPQTCCLAESLSTCSMTFPWYLSCSHLLLTHKIRCAFATVSIGSAFLNSIAIVLDKISVRKRLETARAFASSVTSIIGTNLTFSLLLLALWIVDLVFDKDFVFVSFKWRQRSVCYTMYGFFMFSCVCSPVLLCFFSLSRLRLVENPMKSRLKETKFVVRCTSLLVSLSIILSVLFTVSSWLEAKLVSSSEIPSRICSPFVDPTHARVMIPVISASSIFLQISSLILILVFQMKLLHSLTEHQEKLKGSMSKVTSNAAIIVQFIVFSISNVTCWLPSAIIHILFIAMKEYPMELVHWTTVTVYPVNSLIVPVVFAVTTVRKLRASKKSSSQQIAEFQGQKKDSLTSFIDIKCLPLPGDIGMISISSTRPDSDIPVSQIEEE